MVASIVCEVIDDMLIVNESSLSMAFAMLIPKFSPVTVIEDPVVGLIGEKDIIRGVS